MFGIDHCPTQVEFIAMHLFVCAGLWVGNQNNKTKKSVKPDDDDDV